ncbi:MAG: GNAT family N-acetyltransferase [Archaeoglobaceae archaeon]|nr:GNAT family N-acetyltransferase [Archaeoglobaceae archaeon]
MVIRLAKKEDLDEIVEIEKLSFPNPWNYNYFNAALNDLLIVYEDDSSRRVLGYLVAVCCKENRALIMKLAIHPRYRSKGIATKLLKTTLEMLKNMNVKEVEIDVDMMNKNAIKLYEKLGFKIARTIPMNSEDESFYTMKLKLY